MRTGFVAQNFSRDPKTIKKLTDFYGEFFTEDAKREGNGGRTQRFYQMEDVVVLNSILKWQFQGMQEEQIRLRLADGQRDQDLPAGFRSIEGSTAINVYTEMSSLRTQLIQSNELVMQLRQEIAQLHERHTDEIKAAINETAARYDQRVDALTREAMEWKMRYEHLKEQADKLLDDKHDE